MRTNDSKLDHKSCERARLARDPRFDGLFFTAVTSTGIYCRPVCPAPTAHARNVKYFASAAAAAAAGFRPCLRCRPEAAPGSPLHRGSQELVTGALQLIEEGVLDNASLRSLAQRVGVGERHLRRLFVEQLGANPIQVNTTRRVLFAKKLLSETGLPITEIASASGYASLRRFNGAFRAAYGIAPRELRRKPAAHDHSGYINLRLPYRKPYDFSALLAFFARRAIPGIEVVDGASYQRVFECDGNVGYFCVSQMRNDNALLLRVQTPSSAVLLQIVARVRRMFDLDLDPRVINAQLARDPLLRALVKRHPGQRLPGGWDGFEIAVRAVLGQQISVAAARTFAARLVQCFGHRQTVPLDANLNASFPSPMQLAEADLRGIGLPLARAATIRALAQAVLEGRLHFRSEQTLSQFVESCVALPGIGEWTAHYIAMRALSQPNAFPAADLVLRKVLSQGGKLVSAKILEKRSEVWRPWRAYAVMHLWRSQS